MYPPTKDAARSLHETTETALAVLAEYCLDLWLPLVQDAVLAAAPVEPDADPEAVEDVDSQWQYLVDAVLVYALALIAIDAMRTAYSTFTAVPMKVAEKVKDLVLVDLGAPPKGLPSRDVLSVKVRTTLRRHLNMDVDEVLDDAAVMSALRVFADQVVTDQRGQVIDIVGRVLSRLTRDATNDAVRKDLDTDAWDGAVSELSRTHATSVLNSSVDAAASQAQDRDSDVRIEVTWTAIHDTHTRVAHAHADGQKVPLGSTFTVGGEQLRFPGDPLGSPDNIMNCRCALFATVKQSGGRTADASVIETMSVPADQEETTMGEYRSFTSVLAVIGEPTDDGRMFDAYINLSFRDFPLPLAWQKMSSERHLSSYTVGVIQSAEVQGNQVIGTGYMLNTPEADQAIAEIEHKVTGPSVDLGDVSWELRDESGATITVDDLWDMPMDAKFTEVVTAGKVLGATLVSIPAFGQTSITLGAMVDVQVDQPALVAAAAVQEASRRYAPPVYPAEHFANPEFDGPTHPHITDDGRIMGHLALWNQCHIGVSKRCETAPASLTDYAWFHTSPPVKTDDGGIAKVGRLTVVTDPGKPGHADTSLSVGPAVAHYDNVGTCFAIVHVGEDEHGIWFSGVPAPGVTDEKLTAGLSAPLSGDWRWVSGNYELVAALAVNTPGYGIVASGATDSLGQPRSLIASLGPCRDDAPLTRADIGALAVQVVAEMRAAESRHARASAILGGYNARRARALFSRLEG